MTKTTSRAEGARQAAEASWPMDLDGIAGKQTRRERELLRRGCELGYVTGFDRGMISAANIAGSDLEREADGYYGQGRAEAAADIRAALEAARDAS